MRPLPIQLAFLLLLPGVLHATDTAEVAKRFLQEQAAGQAEQVTVSVQPPAARLSACDRPQPFLPGNGQRLLGRVTVGLRCADGHVRYLQARIDARGTYWVAARAVPAGTRITGDMLEAREGDLTRLPHEAVMDPADATGRVTTRRLARGNVVQTTQLRAPDLVRRNRPVTVEASGQGFHITRQGLALESGAMGDSVRIRMPDRSLLSGVVAGDGRVELDY